MRPVTQQQKTLEEFRRLPPVEAQEMTGLWSGQSIPTGHPLDGVLENLGWFGKRFTDDLRADALLFRSGEQRLIPIDPARILLRLALRFHRFGKTRAAQNLFFYFRRMVRANGTVASVQNASFHGEVSAAMVYDSQPVVDHFRRIDHRRVMGAMTTEGDERIYFFELTRIAES